MESKVIVLDESKVEVIQQPSYPSIDVGPFKVAIACHQDKFFTIKDNSGKKYYVPSDLFPYAISYYLGGCV